MTLSKKSSKWVDAVCYGGYGISFLVIRLYGDKHPDSVSTWVVGLIAVLCAAATGSTAKLYRAWKERLTSRQTSYENGGE